MFEAKFQSFGPNRKAHENQWSLLSPIKQRHSLGIQTVWLTANGICQNKCHVWYGLSLISSAMNVSRTVIFFMIMLYNPDWIEDCTVVNFRWDPSHSLRPASRSCCHNPGLHAFISDISSQCRIACSELYKVRQRRGSLEAPLQLITPPALSLQEGLKTTGWGEMWAYHPLVVSQKVVFNSMRVFRRLLEIRIWVLCLLVLIWGHLWASIDF